ncbi:MAG: LEPR-XLL domain-containing protein, partial [Desulfobacteraceae bacterium]|nr:LEPR-XLL domain-containing protein [Desulfobacteraceae bacterium]
MGIRRTLSRLRKRNDKPSSKKKILFEQFEPRILLSADPALPRLPAADGENLSTAQAIVMQSDELETVAYISDLGLAGLLQTSGGELHAGLGKDSQFSLDPPEVEPNNILSQATNLPLTEVPAGSGLLMAVGTGRQDPAVSGNNWSDPDYWRFEALAGDIVSIKVDTPDSSLNTQVELHSAADSYLVGDSDSGPDNDAFISHYVIAESGTYYIQVGKYSYDSSGPGEYELHLEVARGIQQESDANYSNDSISGANALAMTGAEGHKLATVAGTVMAPAWDYPQSYESADEDFFALGTLNAGNVVDLKLRLPAG